MMQEEILQRRKSTHTLQKPYLPEYHRQYPYTYGDIQWKDLLINYNGNELTYDQIGNLLNDGTYTYIWEEGRQLAAMSKAVQDISFKYNTDGIRTEKQ